MAEEPQTICEWLDIDLNRLSVDDKKSLILEIVDTLPVGNVRDIRNEVESIWEQKLTAEKFTDMEELRNRMSDLADSLHTAMRRDRPGRTRRKKRAPAVVKYRSPDGQTWSGQGRKPLWVTELEAAGGNVDDFLVADAE